MATANRYGYGSLSDDIRKLSWAEMTDGGDEPSAEDETALREQLAIERAEREEDNYHSSRGGW